MIAIRNAVSALAVVSICFFALPSQSHALEPGQFLAAASEFDITPHPLAWEDRNGNGVFDMGAPGKPWDIGEKIKSFKEGPIYIGNGAGQAQYIHAPIGASVLVVEDPETHVRVAYVACDLYLLLQQDTDAIRAKVGVSANISHIVIAPAHNHMGPDTLGLMGLSDVPVSKILSLVFLGGKAKSGINPIWFEDFMHRTALAIEQAAFNLKPATLRVARTKFSFGQADDREPLIQDDDLMTLAIDGVDGEPIATVVQGACHPESVLILTDEKYSLIPQKEIPTEVKEARGHIITSGFPGWVRRHIREKRGGATLYFNGSLGGLISNIFTKIWDPEAHPEYPIETELAKVPEELRIAQDFRYEQIQGREMAKAALKSLATSAEKARHVDVNYAKKDILIPLQNQLFRLVAAVGILGYHRGHLYHDDGTIDDDYGRCNSGVLVSGQWVPKGKNFKTEVSVVNIGPAQFFNIPGELLGELSAGLPADFEAETRKYFPRDAKAHPTGKKYKLLFPPLKKQATRPFPFIISLAGNDVGYIIPKSDFKPPHDIPVPPFAWWWICTDSSGNPHYEESNTVSREVEPRIMGALTEIMKTQKRY
jgi:hypothetical protein